MRDGVYSAIDAEHPDVEVFPEFAEAAAKEVVLSPGEALFIPVGWWHHIRALEVSINLAFTAFKWSNRFEWFYPGKIE
jgi:ribosomal protein L16 Arg81 hydroxylase